MVEKEGLIRPPASPLRGAVSLLRHPAVLRAWSNPFFESRVRTYLEAWKGNLCRSPFHIWRRGRDSNPRYGVTVYTLSRRAPSTTRTPLRYTAFLPPQMPLRGMAERSGLFVASLLTPQGGRSDAAHPARCLAPLRGARLEPSVRCYRIHTFQACSFNHSDTSPERTV